METPQHTLHDKDIHSLFEKFSSPMVNPCISEAQKEKARGISRILWLLLVTGTDSESNVYNALNKVFPHRHDDNVAFGSLYFYKMKTVLTSQEQLQLRRYYSNQEHFRALGTHLRRDTVIPQWFQSSKAAAASDRHAVHG
jgi:hypothetical protein